MRNSLVTVTALMRASRAGRRIWRSFAVCLLVCGLLAQPAMAQEEAGRIFTVFGIEVDVRAQTASEARRQALAEAQERAFTDLMQRLVAADDLYRLSTPQAPDLNALVRSIEVVRERRSSTRYLATLNIGFDPNNIRQLLGDLGVRYTESRSRPYLVLPVFMQAGAWQLWGNHAWAKAWKEGGYRNHLVTFVFADGDFRDRIAVSALDAAMADLAELDGITDRFEPDDVLIARARLESDFSTGRRAVTWDFRTGPGDSQMGQGRLVADAGETVDDLLQRVAGKIMNRLDAAWKAQTILSDDELRWLDVRAPVSQLEDWAALRRRLEEVSLVRDVEIVRVALPVSGFRIQYVGGRDQLKLALAQSRLTLIDDRASDVLVLAENAETFRQRLRDSAEEDIARNSDPANDGGESTADAEGGGGR